MGFGEVRLGEMGLGEMGQNRFYGHDIHATSVAQHLLGNKC